MYTVGELSQIARVPRQLVLRHEDRDNTEAWIHGFPLDFTGNVFIEKPDYLVEVETIAEEDADNVETNRFLVSIDSDITVEICEVFSFLFILLCPTSSVGVGDIMK